MQKIDDCKEIRLALTRAGIATCPEKCLQIFRLVVTAQYIYHTLYVRVLLLGTCKHTFGARTSITGLPAGRDAGNRAYQQQHA
jgi:hypothetical protein